MPFPLEARKRGARTRGDQIEKRERNALMAARADNGLTISDIAREFRLTPQRVGVIVRREREKRGQAA